MAQVATRKPTEADLRKNELEEAQKRHQQAKEVAAKEKAAKETAEKKKELAAATQAAETAKAKRKLAEAKLKVLDHLPVRLIGTTLNDIGSSGEYRYYAYSYESTKKGDQAALRIPSYATVGEVSK